MPTLMDYFASPIAGEWGDEAEDSTDGVPVLRTTNFTADGRLSYDDLTFRAIDTKKQENKILKPGDIIIEKSGGTPKNPVGRCVYFDRDDDYDYFCSNFTAVLRADAKEVNTKYLCYNLQEHYKTRQCLKYQYKTNGIANLDITDYLSHIEVDLPSREIQDKRVDAMDYSQHLLDVHQELLDIMDNSVKSRFIEMFGDPVTNPMGWEVKELQDIVMTDCSISYGIVQTGDPQKEGIPVFRPVDIVDHYPTVDELKKTTKEISDRYKRTILHGDELLITVRANIADTCVIGNEFTGCNVGRGIVPLRFEKNTINKVFIKSQIDMDGVKGALRALAKGITLIQLNMEDLRQFSLVIPPIDLQNQFADFVALADKSKLTIQKSLENLTELRDSLMQEYFG